MSIHAISWASTLSLPPRDKFVLIALCNHHNEDEGAAWMKQETLAKWTCYRRDTINAALHALEHKHGVIRSETRRYPDGRNAPKVYRINRVGQTDSAKPSVGEADPNRVGETDSDSVGETDNKNRQHRSVNSEPPPQSPPTPEAASGSPNGDALSTRQSEAIQKRGSPAEAVVEAYNQHRGRLPAAQKLNSARRRRINQLVKDLGADEAIAAMGIAASEVANDEFWLKHEYGLDNLLAQQRVIQKAETAANRGTTNRTEGRRERYLSALEGL